MNSKLQDINALPRWRTKIIKQTGMIDFSLMSENRAVWSQLGCLGRNANILSVKASFRVARKEVKKKRHYTI